MHLNTHEFELLCELIEHWSGISIDADKMYLLEARLRHLVVEQGCSSYLEFYEKASNAGEQLRDAVISSMTTNETSWFRDPIFYERLRTDLLPDLIAEFAIEQPAPIRFWSAACSTGQEPYSLAILIDQMHERGELGDLTPDQFRITATDICRSALKIAERGRYDPISMRRGLSAELRERYFARDGRTSVLCERIRKRVDFARFNLLDPMQELGRFHLILLRNVMIYFATDSKQRVLGQVRRTLKPNGTLAVGSTEAIEFFTDEFQAVRCGSCAFYRTKEEAI